MFSSTIQQLFARRRAFSLRVCGFGGALICLALIAMSACGGRTDGGANTGGTDLFSIAAPALVNPADPMQYGAKCDGVTNDSAAFQYAVDNGDVLVPAGRTCVINDVVTIGISNRRIECGAGAILRQTVVPAAISQRTMFRFFSPSGLTGNSVVNCHFIGTNTDPPQYTTDDANKAFNIPVKTDERVDNFLLVGNTFERFWGQSMFQTYGQTDGGSGDEILYNTFKSCGYYGPVFVAHRNGLIAHNTAIDCAIGVENDDAAQNTGGNIIEYNTLTAVHGYGAPDMNASVMLTGGATDADYSSNIVRYNTVSGASDAAGYQGAGRPSVIYQAAPYPAQYYGNTCGTGCKVHEQQVSMLCPAFLCRPLRVLADATNR